MDIVEILASDMDDPRYMSHGNASHFTMKVEVVE